MYLRTLLALMAFAVCCAHSPASQAQVYKCVVNGKHVYQQEPCKDPSQRKKLDIKLPARSSEFTDREWKLIGQQKISVGMSEKALLRSWGKPTEINRSSYGPAQWVYRRGAGSAQYVYVQDGYIKNWSD